MNFIEFCKEKNISLGDRTAFTFWYVNNRPTGEISKEQAVSELTSNLEESKLQELFDEFLVWQKKAHIILQERADTMRNSP